MCTAVYSLLVFSIAGSDFLEMFVGVGPARVRDLFAQVIAASFLTRLPIPLKNNVLILYIYIYIYIYNISSNKIVGS